MTIIRTIVVFLILTSCIDTIDTERIVGRYAMLNDTLEILPNKTFKHYFNNNLNSGTWKLSSTGSEVAFDNFTFNPSDGRRGVWYSRVIVTDGEIRLNVNSDISDGYFFKIKDVRQQTTR